MRLSCASIVTCDLHISYVKSRITLQKYLDIETVWYSAIFVRYRENYGFLGTDKCRTTRSICKFSREMVDKSDVTGIIT